MTLGYSLAFLSSTALAWVLYWNSIHHHGDWFRFWLCCRIYLDRQDEAVEGRFLVVTVSRRSGYVAWDWIFWGAISP